jgi:hypothetical protein
MLCTVLFAKKKMVTIHVLCRSGTDSGVRTSTAAGRTQEGGEGQILIRARNLGVPDRSWMPARPRPSAVRPRDPTAPAPAATAPAHDGAASGAASFADDPASQRPQPNHLFASQHALRTQPSSTPQQQRQLRHRRHQLPSSDRKGRGAVRRGGGGSGSGGGGMSLFGLGR